MRNFFKALSCFSVVLFWASTAFAGSSPTTTASLTDNGQTTVTVKVGEPLNFSWNSTNGSGAPLLQFEVNVSDTCNPPHTVGSYYNLLPNNNPPGFTGNYAIPASGCMAGVHYTYYYTVLNSLGQPVTATVLQTVMPQTGVMNILDYGAMCDGHTDDTAAIQSVITVIRASNTGRTILIPSTGHACVVGQLDVTNIRSRLRIVGEASIFGAQSYILCNAALYGTGQPNQGVCLDFSGSDGVNVENLEIFGGSPTVYPPRIVALLAKTATAPGGTQLFGNGSDNTWNSVTINSYGNYGVYNLGGETWNCNQCLFTAGSFSAAVSGVAAVLLSSNNTQNIASPSNGVYLLAPPVSMSAVRFNGGQISTAGSAGSEGTAVGVRLDPSPTGIFIKDIGFTDGYSHVGGPAFIDDAGNTTPLIEGIRIAGWRVEAYNAATTFATFNNVIEQITIDAAYTNASPPTPLQFKGTGNGYSVIGADINLRAADGTGNMPAIVVQCSPSPASTHAVVIHDYEINGGLRQTNKCPGAAEIW